MVIEFAVDFLPYVIKNFHYEIRGKIVEFDPEFLFLLHFCDKAIVFIEYVCT
jgi:hypothetical protein